jgi:hypothetical protein
MRNSVRSFLQTSKTQPPVIKSLETQTSISSKVWKIWRPRGWYGGAVDGGEAEEDLTQSREVKHPSTGSGQGRRKEEKYSEGWDGVLLRQDPPASQLYPKTGSPHRLGLPEVGKPAAHRSQTTAAARGLRPGKKIGCKRAQRAQGSLCSRVRQNAVPPRRAPQQEEIHHQDTKAPRGCRFLRLVSWCLGGSFSAAALAQRAVLPLVRRARPSYAAAAMRKIRQHNDNFEFVPNHC